MIGEILARRYSDALFSVGQKRNMLETLASELDDFVGFLKINKKIHDFFMSPLINIDRKKEIIEKVFSKEFSVQMIGFLNLLLDKHRQMHIEIINKLFQKEIKKFKGEIDVAVTSAVSMDEEDLGSVKSHLEKSLNKQVSLSLKKDPSIIGGLVVQVGNTVYDASISGVLGRIRNTLLSE